jgi:hypothetical protein
VFVPAVLEHGEPEPEAGPHRTRRRKAQGIELEIGGVAVRIGVDANPQAIAAVIRALKAARRASAR